MVMDTDSRIFGSAWQPHRGRYFLREGTAEMADKITTKDWIPWGINAIYAVIVLFCSLHIGALKDEHIKDLKTIEMMKDERIKYVETQRDEYEKKYIKLKDQFEKMNIYVNQLINEYKQAAPLDQSIKNVKEKINDIYRNSIPLSYQIEPQKMKEEVKE